MVEEEVRIGVALVYRLLSSRCEIFLSAGSALCVAAQDVGGDQYLERRGGSFRLPGDPNCQRQRHQGVRSRD
jgi:hypothetical protein